MSVHVVSVHVCVYDVCVIAITIDILSSCDYVSRSDSVIFWPICIFLMILSTDWNMYEIQ